ncbi:ATP-binding protein [Cellulomonas sp. Marseille-Q8402]
MSRSVGHAPFVARDEQVTTLLAAVARAAAGEPGLVLLGADAGVGKTRLLTHAARLATERGATVVVSHSIDLGEIGLPYLPFAEALHQLVEAGCPGVAEVVADRPALRRLLPSSAAGPTTGDEQAERLQLFDGVASVLAAAGRPDAPLVLVLEDLHWADASSRDLLRFLVARLRTEPVLLIGSYRADDLHRRHPLRPVLAELGRHPRVERIGLPPFTAEELRSFTTALAGHPLPEDALRRIQTRSEGNAYFAEELLEARGAGTDLPGTLADVLRARLELLDPEVQRLARAASAAGRRVDEPLLRAVVAGADGDPARHAAFDAALRDAVAHHVLVGEDGRIAFRHALLAEAVYADLLPGEQVSLHRDYLLAAAADPSLATSAERAHHALLSHDNRLALLASRDAAREAGRVLAPAEELRHLETVLRLWPGVPSAAEDLGEERVDVLLAAAAAGGRAGLGDRAVAMAREAVAVVDAGADDAAPRRVATLRTTLARHLLGAERVEEALLETDRALTALADLADPHGAPDADRAWALATHARAALNSDLDDQAELSAAAAVDGPRRGGGGRRGRRADLARGARRRRPRPCRGPADGGPPPGPGRGRRHDRACAAPTTWPRTGTTRAGSTTRPPPRPRASSSRRDPA